MEHVLQPLTMHGRNASTDSIDLGKPLTRGTKRAAAVGTPVQGLKGQENVPIMSASKSKLLDASKMAAGNKFGFRPTPTAVSIVQPAEMQQAKRRRTGEFEEPHMEDVSARQAHVSSSALEPLLLGPCDSIASLWRETMMDEAMAAECKAALAGKISASKFDYKVRTQMREKTVA